MDRPERRGRRRLTLDRELMSRAIAEMTATMNRALTPQAVVDAVGEVVREFTGWFGVALGLTDAEDPVLDQYWSAPLNDTVRARYLRVPLHTETPQTRAVRLAEPVFVPDADTLQAMFPGPFRDAQTEGLGACAALPLLAPDGRVFGSLALMWADELQFRDEDMEFAVQIGTVTAQAVERVQAAERERSIGVALQTALLTLDLHSLAVVADARYVSADTALQVGGDWYDAIERRDGKVVVAVGDVPGKGLDAAATMGRLRSSLGITALQTPDPARVLRYLDDYAEHVPGATTTTVAIAVYDPLRERLSHVSAGHPPGLVAKPDGTVELLRGGRSWPLNIDMGSERTGAATVSFPAGSLLLLYTDGVVERRGEILDEGIGRLAVSLGRNWNLPIRQLLAAILDELAADRGGAHDDEVLIALRSMGSSPVHLVDSLPATANALAPARHRFRAWLAKGGTADDVAAGMVVAFHEVVSNAVVHGSGMDAGKPVWVEACRRADDTIVSVHDSGSWRPGIEQDPTEGGRGFRLIEKLSDEAHIDSGALGTTVTLVWHAGG